MIKKMIPFLFDISLQILMCKNTLDIQILASVDNFIIAMVLNDLDSSSWKITRVYGLTNPLLKPEFWDKLNCIGVSFDGSWCLPEDFNALLEKKDKLGGRNFTSGSICRFRKMIDDNGLLNL